MINLCDLWLLYNSRLPYQYSKSDDYAAVGLAYQGFRYGLGTTPLL